MLSHRSRDPVAPEVRRPARHPPLLGTSFRCRGMDRGIRGLLEPPHGPVAGLEGRSVPCGRFRSLFAASVWSVARSGAASRFQERAAATPAAYALRNGKAFARRASALPSPGLRSRVGKAAVSSTARSGARSRPLGGYEGEPSLVGVALEALERQDPLQGRHAARAELGAGGVAELLQRLRGRPRGAVDAGRQH